MKSGRFPFKFLRAVESQWGLRKDKRKKKRKKKIDFRAVKTTFDVKGDWWARF